MCWTTINQRNPNTMHCCRSWQHTPCSIMNPSLIPGFTDSAPVVFPIVVPHFFGWGAGSCTRARGTLNHHHCHERRGLFFLFGHWAAAQQTGSPFLGSGEEESENHSAALPCAAMLWPCTLRHVEYLPPSHEPIHACSLPSPPKLLASLPALLSPSP